MAEDRPLEPTRPQIATLVGSMAVLRPLFRAATAEEPAGDALTGAVAAAIDDGLPLRVSARTAAEIRNAIELAREFELKLIRFLGIHTH